MSLKDRIENDYKLAFKEGNKLKVDCLRLLKAAIKNSEIAKRKDFEDAEVLEVVMSQAKQRHDSIAAYERGGRADLVRRETEELGILHHYLPAQLSEAELEDIIREIITATGAASAKDFGRVMKEVINKVKGQADGKMVASIVQKILSEKKSA